MKVGVIAEYCGVSVATMYRKLAEGGKTLDDYRDDRGEVTTVKLEELKTFIASTRDDNLTRRVRDILQEKRTRTEIEELKKQLAAAQAELSMARQTIAKYEYQLDALNKQFATTQQIASQAQQLQLQQMAQMNQLLASGEGRKARGFFARIFGRATTGNGNAANGKEE